MTAPRAGGDTAGPPLVLVHGYLGGAAQWDGLIAALDHPAGTIALDLPGFSAAADQPSPDSIEGFARHVVDEIDRRGVDRFILLGHSMGGMIAQEVARRVPDRVDRLILYGTGAHGAMPDRFEPIDVSVRRLHRDGVGSTVRRIVTTWFLHGAAHEAFESLCRIGAETSPEAARSALLAMAAWDGRAALASLSMPCLVIWGEHDRSYRWAQIERLWSGLPDVSLAVIPRASHAAHLEKPAIFDCLLRDFLRETARP